MLTGAPMLRISAMLCLLCVVGGKSLFERPAARCNPFGTAPRLRQYQVKNEEKPMQVKKLSAAVAAAMSVNCVTQAAVTEKPSTLADQQSVAVTIYNENLALIKDTRRIALDMGENRLALREVSGQMRPETA